MFVSCRFLIDFFSLFNSTLRAKRILETDSTGVLLELEFVNIRHIIKHSNPCQQLDGATGKPRVDGSPKVVS